MNTNLVEATLLANAVTYSLDILYNYSVMYSDNSIDDKSKIDGLILTIHTAAERLSEIIEKEEEQINDYRKIEETNK